MDSSSCRTPAGRDCSGFFALVSYVPEPLGSFLNQLRAELVPGCKLLSHVTLLPPRCLKCTAEELIEEMSARLARIPSFEITLGEVELFESTGVIYIALRNGRRELEAVHRELSSGVFAYDEPFPFHPHITLAQELPAGRVEPSIEHAREAWRDCPLSRTFVVDQAAFVRNATPTQWDTLSEHTLQPATLLRTA